MAYFVSQLISDAFNLSQIVALNYETMSGAQLTQGLGYLNDILGTMQSESRLIPYFTKYCGETVVNQEMYFIPGLIEIETFTFDIQTNIRYPSMYQTRKDYFGSARIINLQVYPFSWHPERTVGGTNLYLFPQSSAIVPFTIFGKFSLTSVLPDQDISTLLDGFYINFLKFNLAAYICMYNGQTVPSRVDKQLNDMNQWMMDQSGYDLTLQKGSTLRAGYPVFNYGMVNVYIGYLPSWN